MADEEDTTTIYIESPPRLTGSPVEDTNLINNWLYKLYDLINPKFSSFTSSISSLEENLETVEETANSAYEKTNGWMLSLNAVTISDDSTTASITFSEEQDDIDYMLVLQVSSITGSPDPEACIVTTITKETTGATISIDTMPGTDNAVTFDVFLARNN